MRSFNWYDFQIPSDRDRTEEAKRKHEAAVRMGLLDKNVPVKYGTDGAYRIDPNRKCRHS